MSLIKNISVAAVIALAYCAPTLALPRMGPLEPGLAMKGEVESSFPSIGLGHLINVVKIKTESGETKSVAVDPNLNQAVKFDKGMKVKMDTTKMVMGKVVGLGRSGVTVMLDGAKDEPKTYFLSREQRRYLSLGDRIVVTPYQRLVRADTVGLYPLYIWPDKSTK